MIKKFSFPLTKSPTDFFAQNSLQFNRRARRSWRGDIDNSSLVLWERVELSRLLGTRS